MTYEQNVKAILESNFAGFKEEIIDIACKRICMLETLETKEETIDRVLEIIDRKIGENMDHTETPNDYVIACIDIQNEVSELKGGEKA